MVLNSTSDLNATSDVIVKLISDDTIQYIYTINFSIVCGTCCIFGIITNFINIVVFARQGFQDSINIALMGLSVSDLCSLISLLWTTICFNPLFMYSERVPLYSLEVQHISGGWTHVIFTRITAFITTYITLERCLCIAFPLKVKRLLTPNRVTAIIPFIYLLILATMSPGYYSVQLGWKFYPSLNKTLVGIVFAKDRYLIQTMTFYLNFVYPILSFSGVVVCSTVLIWKLNERGKWLRSSTAGQEKKMVRDRQVVKMVIWVAVIFISTFFPSLVFFLVISVRRDISMSGSYQNLFLLLCSLTFTLDAINSGVNIFVYYAMSSNYKSICRSLFCLGDARKK